MLGHLRIHPPSPHGLFPFLDSRNLNSHDAVSFVSFAHRKKSAGGFYDYTARYGAVREEDKITLRESMFPETIPKQKWDWQLEEGEKHGAALEQNQVAFKMNAEFEELVQRLGLKDLLDLPLVALSNGQTRRARIIKALLKKPEL